jgi:outer membrane lipoprotein carrier protein
MQPLIRSFAVAVTLAIGALAAAPADAGARDELKRFTAGLQGLDGQFSQQVTDSRGRIKERSTGRVALATPRQFRWEYKTPHAQLIIADGRRVWAYEPDLEQVTVRAQGEQEQNSPLAALIDPALLERQYDLSEEAAPRDGLNWLSLSPKQGVDTSFDYAALGFGANGLARMEILDTLGQRTVISFSGWQRNPRFAGDTFRFTPPAGVDVVGER